MSRKIFLVLIAVALIGLVAIVFSDESILLSTKNVVLVGYSKYSEEWIDIREGAISSWQKQGINVTAVACDSIISVNDQIQLIEQAIADRADAIIIMPTDINELSSVLEKANNNNIDIIMIDNYQNFTDFYIQRVGTNINKLGVDMAENIAEIDDNDIKIGCIFSYGNNGKSLQIYQEFMSSISRYDNITVIERSITAADENVASAEAGILLNTNDLDYLVCFEEIITKGASDYLSKKVEAEEGVRHKTKIIGIGNIDECAKYLEDDIIYSLGVQSYYNMGYLAVENFAENLMSDTYTSHYIVHKEDLQNEQFQKILFRIK